MTRKKYISWTLGIVFLVLTVHYVVDFGRFDTRSKMVLRGSHSDEDYMLSSVNVTSLAQDRKGLVWIGTSAGINVYDGQDYIQFFHDSRDTTALPDDYINALHCDPSGRMWVGTQNGLARYVGGYRFSRVALPAGDSYVTDIRDTPFGLLEVSTLGRIYQVDTLGRVQSSRNCGSKSHPLPYFLPQGVPSSLPVLSDTTVLRKPADIISATYRDADSNLWVGYHNAGYQVISDNIVAFKHANANNMTKVSAGNNITSLECVGHSILAGTTRRIYVYDQLTGHTAYTFHRQLTPPVPGTRQYPVDMVALDDQRLWVIYDHEVLGCRLQGTGIRVESRTAGQAGQPLYLGYGTRLGNDLYLSCSGGRMLRCRYGQDRPDFLPVCSRWYDAETQLTTLRDGRLLLFMKNMHVALYTPRTGRLQELPLKGTPGEANIDPAFARQDSRGIVWLGTKRFGLYRLDLRTDSVHHMDFLSDVHIQALEEDSLGQLWITTLRDVTCYQPATGAVLMNSLVSSSQNQWSRQYFDNSICLSPDGKVVLGSSDGCIFLPPSAGDSPDEGHRERQQRLCIYSLDIQDKDGRLYSLNDNIQDGSSYTLAYDQNDLHFRFFYPNYSRASSLMYQYRLDGYQNNWQEPTYKHEAHFSNLAPGRYTFRLRLISSPTLPPLAEQQVTVIVRRAPWSSAPAWMFYLCCLALVGYYVLRVNLEKRTNEMNMSFFANISHEFRNPITIIAGPLLALKSDPTLPASVQDTLDRVCMSVNRMLRLIDQMLDFNQLETDALRLKVSEEDAGTLLQQMAATFEVSTRVRAIRLTVTVEGDCSGVWLDTDKMEKIVSNLFTNALKHTPDGGEIRLAARREGEELRVSVFNNGPHIAPDKLPNVFKRYYQLADMHGTHHYGWGSGIGLYYVKRLVGLHHGTITVNNVEGGVEFVFTLPVQRLKYQPMEQVEQGGSHVMQLPVGLSSASAADEENAPAATQRRKILIVDDDQDVALYIRSLFADRYEVVNRYSAESALQDLEQTAPDIILSDIIMGHMSGYDFCRHIKQDLLFSHIPVVLITAKSNMSEQIDGLRLGAVAYVTKPFDPFYLQAIVEAQLQNIETLRHRLGESTRTEQIASDTAVSDTLSPQDRRFMDDLYSYMEQRAAQLDLNVTTVCRDLLISPSKFNYKLKQLTGDTPGTFFRKYKLNHAAALLREGGHSVAEVAVMTGFATAAHFSVAFKKQFGVSPSEYK